jgi:hypothetical protein
LCCVGEQVESGDCVVVFEESGGGGGDEGMGVCVMKGLLCWWKGEIWGCACVCVGVRCVRWKKERGKEGTHPNVHTHTHTHTHIYIYMYIYTCTRIHPCIHLCTRTLLPGVGVDSRGGGGRRQGPPLLPLLPLLLLLLLLHLPVQAPNLR